MVFLQGRLQFQITEARNLPDSGIINPYVRGVLGEVKLFKTKRIKNSVNPHWNEQFTVYACDEASYLKIEVKHRSHFKASIIGEVLIETQDLKSGASMFAT